MLPTLAREKGILINEIPPPPKKNRKWKLSLTFSILETRHAAKEIDALSLKAWKYNNKKTGNKSGMTLYEQYSFVTKFEETPSE